MIKFFIAMIISLSILHADTTPQQCKQDLTEMLGSYYKADNAKLDGNSLEARKNYTLSLESAYAALESCMANENYNFEMIFSFIQKGQEGLESTQN